MHTQSTASIHAFCVCANAEILSFTDISRYRVAWFNASKNTTSNERILKSYKYLLYSIILEYLVTGNIKYLIVLEII